MNRYRFGGYGDEIFIAWVVDQAIRIESERGAAGRPVLPLQRTPEGWMPAYAASGSSVMTGTATGERDPDEDGRLGGERRQIARPDGEW